MTQAFICDAVRTPIGRYAGALSSVRADDLAAIPIRALVERNPSVDWGDLDDYDKRQNDAALESGEDRLFSSYQVAPGLQLWIITEWDRSVTTLLLPSEY